MFLAQLENKPKKEDQIIFESDTFLSPAKRKCKTFHLLKLWYIPLISGRFFLFMIFIDFANLQ